MTPRLHTGWLVALFTAGFLFSTGTADAETNRVLPFWSQPFPVGYTRYETGITPVARPCRIRRRFHARHGVRTVVINRCRPVLHARD